jgi:RNA polymerase sigma-70 factor, ECF subfamily
MQKQAVINRPMPRNDIDDTALIALVASGDTVAFKTLYLAYHDRVARFLARFIRSRENIEEVIDDTFMVVWRKAKDFRQASRVSTWIIGIGYRTALKSIRSAKCHLPVQDVEDRAQDRSDHAVEFELQDWVKKGLEQLPLEQRLILELAYGLGHSIEEIATITSSPVGTVKTRMFYARAQLRHYLPALGAPSSHSHSHTKS